LFPTVGVHTRGTFGDGSFSEGKATPSADHQGRKQKHGHQIELFETHARASIMTMTWSNH
jgi:hypothetical protein